MRYTKIIILIFITTLLGSCSSKDLSMTNKEFIGQWKSEDSLISICKTGRVKYFFKFGGMSGRGAVISDTKIKFWIIIVPKVFKITRAIDKESSPMTIELDGVEYEKISDEPQGSLLDMKLNNNS